MTAPTDKLRHELNKTLTFIHMDLIAPSTACEHLAGYVLQLLAMVDRLEARVEALEAGK